MDGLEILIGLRIFVVNHRPSVKPMGKCFVLPDEERSWVDYSCLDDLMPWEDAPSDRVNFVFFYVFVLVTAKIDGLK